MLALAVVYLADHDVLPSLVLPVSLGLLTVPLAQDAGNKMHPKVKESHTDFAEGTVPQHQVLTLFHESFLNLRERGRLNE